MRRSLYFNGYGTVEPIVLRTSPVVKGRFKKGMLIALKLEKLATPGVLPMQNIMISCTDVIWHEPL